MSRTEAEEGPRLWDRLAALVYRARRRAAIVLAMAIAAFLAYHVIYGANGLTAYQRKRSEDRTLKKQILDLERENSLLSEHVDRLKRDPGAIEHEARTILHYARPGDVIYKLNGDPRQDGKTAAK